MNQKICILLVLILISSIAVFTAALYYVLSGKDLTSECLNLINIRRKAEGRQVLQMGTQALLNEASQRCRELSYGMMKNTSLFSPYMLYHSYSEGTCHEAFKDWDKLSRENKISTIGQIKLSDAVEQLSCSRCPSAVGGARFHTIYVSDSKYNC